MRGLHTERFTSRNIILSLRCRIGDIVSPDTAAGVCEGLGALIAPLGAGELLFVGRWVMGLLPDVQAAFCGGFLRRQVSRNH